MASVFEISAQIDDLLADFPPVARMKASADILTILLRAQREKEREISDMEAARLLPLGAEVVVQMQGCHRSTAYRRAERARLSRVIQADATRG
jgi:hypothetical protein